MNEMTEPLYNTPYHSYPVSLHLLIPQYYLTITTPEHHSQLFFHSLSSYPLILVTLRSSRWGA